MAWRGRIESGGGATYTYEYYHRAQRPTSPCPISFFDSSTALPTALSLKLASTLTTLCSVHPSMRYTSVLKVSSPIDYMGTLCLVQASYFESMISLSGLQRITPAQQCHTSGAAAAAASPVVAVGVGMSIAPNSSSSSAAWSRWARSALFPFTSRLLWASSAFSSETFQI